MFHRAIAATPQARGRVWWCWGWVPSNQSVIVLVVGSKAENRLSRRACRSRIKFFFLRSHTAVEPDHGLLHRRPSAAGGRPWPNPPQGSASRDLRSAGVVTFQNSRGACRGAVANVRAFLGRVGKIGHRVVQALPAGALNSIGNEESGGGAISIKSGSSFPVKD